MKLNISTIRSAKPKAKPYKLSDGKGLFLLVNRNGSKWWRFSYRFNGKQKTLSMGVFPDTGLAEARRKVNQARELLASDKDPAEKRKERKAKKKGADSFETIARQWLNTQSNEWSASHTKSVVVSLEQNIFPELGHEPIKDITPLRLLSVLRQIESRGALEMLKKIRQRCNAIFVYAKIHGLIESNPAEGLSQALQKHKPQNYNSISLKELPELINALNSYPLEPTTKAGLQLALYTFQRTNEIRGAQWHEFDLDAGLWTIPAERMKMKREHIVPLSKQVINILKDLHPITGHYPFVFASSHKPQTQPFSENAMLYALYRMGFHGRMTVHGFRHLASTTLNELGYDSRHVEKQLSHEDKNEVRGTYNKALYLPARIKMMQEWADFVDNAHTGKVIPINSKAN